jgi:hypothetical protein
LVVATHRLTWAVGLVGCLLAIGLAGAAASAMAAPDSATPFTIGAPSPGLARLAQAQPAAPAIPPAPAATPESSPTPAASDEPIGNVATLSGVATVIRNRDSIALKLKDDIFLNDTVQTSADSALGVTFNDGTTFHLSANARITIDSYVYEDGGNQNAGLFGIGKGTVAFVAAAVAKTGDMKITTPTTTLGIRGTTGLVEVPDGGAAGGSNVNIKLYPDPDGHVGRIEVNDRTGQRLGALTQGASGFTIRPPRTPGGRVSAVPLTISPQQAARDQGFVRQVHAAQSVGRQIVTEQRAIRRANPNLNRPNQPRPQSLPQAPQRPNTLPGQKGQQGAPKGHALPGVKPQAVPPNRPGREPPGQQPGKPGQPERSGQSPQPGEKPGGQPQPAIVPRPGDNPRQGGEPGTPPQPNLRQPALRQGAPNPRPGLQRPGAPGRPAVLPGRRPPKGKRPPPQ